MGPADPPLFTAPQPGHGRCAIHDLGAGPDGRCVLCRRAAAPRTDAGNGWVIGGVMVLLAALGGGIVWKAGRGVARARGAGRGPRGGRAGEPRAALHDEVVPVLRQGEGVAERAARGLRDPRRQSDPSGPPREPEAEHPRKHPDVRRLRRGGRRLNPQAYAAALERGAAHAPR